MVQVFTLQQNARAARVGGESRHLGDDGGSAGVRRVQLGKFTVKLRVEFRLGIRRRELVECRDEGLRHKTPAELSEERPLLVAKMG